MSREISVFPWKIAFCSRFFFEGAYKRSNPRSRSNFPKDGRVREDSVGRVDVYPPSPAYQSLYFPFFSGIRTRGGEEDSPASKRNWKPTRYLPGDTAEFAKGRRNAIPLGIRRAYTFSRERRKYCAATNKNMYRVFGEECLPLTRATFSSPFSRQRAEWFAKIREFELVSGEALSRSQKSPPIFLRATRNSAASKGANHKCSLSDSYFSFNIPFWFLFLENFLEGNLLSHAPPLHFSPTFTSRFLTRVIFISRFSFQTWFWSWIFFNPTFIYKWG